MTEGQLNTSPLTGMIAQWKLIPDLRMPPVWAKFAVSFSDDDLTETRKFFRGRAEANRWASYCDHPTTVIDLRERSA